MTDNNQERALFEKAFPVPEGLEWNGTAYVTVGRQETSIFVHLCRVAAAYDKMHAVWQARAQLPAGGAVPDVERWSVGWGGGSEVIEEPHPQGDYVRWEDYEVLRALLAALHPVSGEQKPSQVSDDQFVEEFMAWWESEGQYARSGGGDYERTFAFQAWRHLMPSVLAYRATSATPVAQEPKPKPDALRKRFSDIEDEIMEGKHNAQSVFTAMRTAALYIGQPAAQEVSGLIAALHSCAKASTAAEVGMIVDGALAAISTQQGGQS